MPDRGRWMDYGERAVMYSGLAAQFYARPATRKETTTPLGQWTVADLDLCDGQDDRPLLEQKLIQCQNFAEIQSVSGQSTWTPPGIWWDIPPGHDGYKIDAIAFTTSVGGYPDELAYLIELADPVYLSATAPTFIGYQFRLRLWQPNADLP